MTGQDLLNSMEVLNQELQLQTSEADVVRGLLALNMAQDYWESLAAQEGAIKGDSTGDVVTAGSTETTAFPTGFLRIDRIQPLNDTTLLPEGDLDNLNEAGSHINGANWPVSLYSTASPGKPSAYYTNGRNIYWSPLPDDVYTFRCYGFKSQSDITVSGTFAYDDVLRLPFASFAVQILRIGVGDDIADVNALAKSTFQSALGAMAGFNRDGAAPLVYRYGHDT